MKGLGISFNIDEVKEVIFLKAAVAEVIGTATLITIGCGAVATLSTTDGTHTISVALSFGLALTLSIWAFGHLGGTHVNPAVSVGFLVIGGIGLAKCLIFIVCQLVGSVLGAGIIWLTLPSHTRGTLGCTLLAEGVEQWQGFLVEIISTFLLAMTVFASTDRPRTDNNGPAALSIGFCVTANICWSCNITGGSMNPARSFGPAVWAGLWKDHWLYWTAPFLGGIIAAITYQKIFAARIKVTIDEYLPPQTQITRKSVLKKTNRKEAEDDNGRDDTGNSDIFAGSLIGVVGNYSSRRSSTSRLERIQRDSLALSELNRQLDVDVHVINTEPARRFSAF